MQPRSWSPIGGRDWPVVVVGAGPAGLVAATALARSGLRVLLVAKAAPSTHPKATVASLRSMELLRSWGLADRVMQGGNDVEWRMLLTSTLAAASSGRLIEVGLPSVAESVALSPTRPWAVPQDHLEAVLLDELRRRPSARIQLDAIVEDVRPEPDGVRITVRDIISGRDREIVARYVVAADGAYSAVRTAVGISAPASPAQEATATAVAHAPLWKMLGDHRYGIYGTEVPTPGTFLPAGPDDRWVVGFHEPTGLPVRDPDRMIELIRAGAGVSDLPVRLGPIKDFTFVAALAERFRSGRVFLVGDAAHRVTPRGGTGMNMAIAGAANLAWKLAWVLRGWAPQALLDTYESERRPVAEHNIARSLDPLGSRRGVADEVRVDLAGRIPHRWLPTESGRVSTLDLIGDGLTRLVPSEDPLPMARPMAGPPVRVRRIDRASAAALGADRPGGLLVRPDGIPVNGAVGRLLVDDAETFDDSGAVA